MSSDGAVASYFSGNAQLSPVHLVYTSLQLPQNIQRVAARKLEQLNAATVFETLRIPPGNRLEVLTGDRQGQHSIRVNDQWRVCFVWRDNNVFDVEIVDYH